MMMIVVMMIVVIMIMIMMIEYSLFEHEQEPNPEDPLNREAADVLQSNRRLFEQNVRKAMSGGMVGSTCFDRCIKQ